MTESTQIPLQPSQQYYRTIFNKYDKDRDGFISLKELNDLIESREYDHDIPSRAIRRIHEIHDENEDGKLDFQEFYAMMTNPDMDYLFGHYITRYINLLIPKIHHPATTVTDGEYEEEYSFCPPPVGMILISLIEIIFFTVDEIIDSNSSKYGTGPIDTLFIYEPNRRREVWRYVTYMFVHVGYFHLIVNLLVQILLGIPLEMVHRWWRVLLVYFAGVLAGSLGTSIVDSSVRLAGASGGVYSLVTAHVASIIMNWKEMSFPAAQLFIFLIVAGSDISTAIYNRYVLNIDENVGYAAHFAGALAGLLVGINLLRNLSVTRTERVIWWISIVTYSVLMVIGIIWNLAWKNYFLAEVY